VYLESLSYKFLKRLEAKGAFVPCCAIASGIVLEDQIYKAIALGAPYVQAICMGRSTLTAAMVGKTQAQRLEESYGRGEGYREALLRTFIGAAELLDKYNNAFEQIPPVSIAVYTYYDRLSVGLRQLMAGCRKFDLKYIGWDDIVALTRDAADVSGIP